MRKRESQLLDPVQLHAFAVREVEPLFQSLRDVVEECANLAKTLHHNVSSATEGPRDVSEVWNSLRLADIVEQDAQLKSELVLGLTHGSTPSDIAATHALWESQPWLGQLALVGIQGCLANASDEALRAAHLFAHAAGFLHGPAAKAAEDAASHCAEASDSAQRSLNEIERANAWEQSMGAGGVLALFRCADGRAKRTTRNTLGNFL